MSEYPTSFQASVMKDGRVIAGDYPDFATRSSIYAQSQVETMERERSKAGFLTIVDTANLNGKYAQVLALTERYFKNEGLEISPLRIIERSTLRRAYQVAGQADDTIQGGNMNGRALIVEDEEMTAQFGDEFILGVALHEAAHSTSGASKDFLRTAQKQGLKVRIGGIAINERSFTRVDLRNQYRYKVIGEFLEEAFADLTRVRALRSLGKTHDIEGSTGDFTTEGGTIMCCVPNDSSLSIDESIPMPAEFALLSKSLSNENQVMITPSNFAAYALELLDNRITGLYEDLRAARTDPTRQRRAIQKIESLRPGLYGELRDLDYSEKGFVQGLMSVLNALKQNETAVDNQKQTVSY